MMAACIALGIQESTDSSLSHNPFAILKSLQGLSDRLLVFCEAGQIIAMPPEKSPLMLLLDKMIVPVKLKEIKGKGYPSFHSKTWTLQFADKDGNKVYRYIVLSRNLTFDRSWDVAASLDGMLTKTRHRSSYPIVDFLGFLKDKALDGVSLKTEKRRILNALIQELPYVQFSLDDKRFRDFEIIPLGIGTTNIDDDPLLKESFHELLIISPFLSETVIRSFDKRRRLKDPLRRHLITRTTELHKIAGKLDTISVFTVKDTVVEGEEIVSDAESTKVQQQDIHAKMYLITKDTNSFLYLGSMNASEYGLYRNVEMLIKLSAYRSSLRMDLVESDLFGPDEKTNPFEKVDFSEIDVSAPEKEERDDLERKLKGICHRLKANAEVVPNGDNYSVKISVSSPRGGCPEAEIAPARTARTQPLSEEVMFNDISALELTELYRITIKGKTDSITRMILIPTKMPDNRDEMVIRSILNNKRAFIDYLAFILGDDYVLSAMEIDSSFISDHPSRNSAEESLPAIYEKMLKTAFTEPDRLKEIRHIIDRISDTDVIPEEFVQMYNTFVKTLRMR